MHPPVLDVAQIAAWIARMWWPILRIGGFLMAAPIASENAVPGRVKIILGVTLTVLLAPLAPVPANLSVFSGAGVLTALQEMLIGVAIGMVVQLSFEALTFAGQSISMTMGLGFGNLVDPVRGVNSAVVGQIFTTFATLTYLAINGHLILLGALANSFQSLPIGAANIDAQFLWAVTAWGGRIFETGLLIALPAVIALVIVNLALGVVTRAAPQLNLFGIGFPITLLAGLFVLMAGLDGVMAGITTLIQGALTEAVELVSPAAGVH